jgi:hypothetical protein
VFGAHQTEAIEPHQRDPDLLRGHAERAPHHTGIGSTVGPGELEKRAQHALTENVLSKLSLDAVHVTSVSPT